LKGRAQLREEIPKIKCVCGVIHTFLVKYRGQDVSTVCECGRTIAVDTRRKPRAQVIDTRPAGWIRVREGRLGRKITHVQRLGRRHTLCGTYVRDSVAEFHRADGTMAVDCTACQEALGVARVLRNVIKDGTEPVVIQEADHRGYSIPKDPEGGE